MSMTVVAVNLSQEKGVRKTPVDRIELRENHGIVGDAHAGPWHRQISLLGQESVDKLRAAMPDLKAGDFAENILTQGLELCTLPIGTILNIGDCQLEVTQIGKECHHGCEIRHITGDCVMPREGIFAKVMRSGTIQPGDEIEVLDAKEG